MTIFDEVLADILAESTRKSSQHLQLSHHWHQLAHTPDRTSKKVLCYVSGGNTLLVLALQGWLLGITYVACSWAKASSIPVELLQPLNTRVTMGATRWPSHSITNMIITHVAGRVDD
jgi:hypothetical protein